MQIIIGLLVALFLLWMLYLILLRPDRIDVKKYPWLTGHTFAHRGLFLRSQIIPENSITAFQAAINEGYGIEFDLQLTADNQLVVFHDDNVKRMTGVDKDIRTMTVSEIQGLTLAASDQKIPLFTEVLQLIGGKVPLIIELKNCKHNKVLCQKTYEQLRKYKGDYCIESFAPDIVRWFYKHAPKILRGQLSMKFPLTGPKTTVFRFLLGKLVFNGYAHPQFIAYNVKNSSLGLDLSRKMGAATVAWTVKTKKELDKAKYYFDSYIFEQSGQE